MDGKGRSAGTFNLGRTELEYQRMEMLLQPNVKTYADAAKRLGITEAAIKKTMERVLYRYSRAKLFCNQIEEWKRKRKERKVTG